MVRFRPDSGQLEYLSTSSQFGHSLDAWGHHFTVSNEDHIRQEVIRAAYLTRNPDLPVGSAMERISDHRPAADVYPITHGARVEMLSGVGSFTSACGITVYLGGAFPPSLGLFSLVAEPAQNLVHRDVLTPSGATLCREAGSRRRGVPGVDRRLVPSRELLHRTRRRHLHGRLLPPDRRTPRVDVHAHPPVAQPVCRRRPRPHLPDFAGDAAAASRHDPARPGFGSGAGAAAGQPEHLVAPHGPASARSTAEARTLSSRSRRCLRAASPRSRACTRCGRSKGFTSSTQALIEKALEDPEAGVRENAILLAEPRLSGNPALIERLLKMERDPDRRVQFQLLSTLGGINSRASRRGAGPPAGAGHRRSLDADRRAQRLLGPGATAVPHRDRIRGQADRRPRHLLSPDRRGDRRAAEDRRRFARC